MHLDERRAREVVLVQAIESTDTEGRFVGAAERDPLEQQALEAVRDPARPLRPESSRYLTERARRFLDIVAKRDSRVARLAQADPWQSGLAWAVPLVAFVLGLMLDRLGDPHKLDLLSPPLMLFIAWNFAMYLVLVAALFLRGRARERNPVTRFNRFIAALPARMGERVNARVRGSVIAQFRLLWWRVAGAVESARVQQVLHASAAAWAAGIAISIVAGGIVREYRIGWESLWLSAPQVHAILSALFAPVVALLPFDGFTLAEIERVHSAAGVHIGVGEAQKWVKLYVGLLVLAVVLPRALLALAAMLRKQVLARRLRIDLADPYYAATLGRVSPARVVVQVVRAGEQASAILSRVLREAGADRALHTVREDQLLFVERAQEPADQVWLAVDDPAQFEAAVDALPPSDAKLIVLHQGVFHAASHRARRVAETVSLADAAACWPLEAPLLDALGKHVHDYKRAGVERLVQLWRQNQRDRWDESVRALAAPLAFAARRSEAVGGERTWWKEVLDTEARDARRGAEEAAMARVLESVDAELAASARELLRLHSLDDAADMPSRLAPAALVPMNTGKAGLAGAAAGIGAGALAGAKIDLLSAGMTMGAGAALGALIGGTGAFGAARWLNAGGPKGTPLVRLADEQLDALAELQLLRYLFVIHAGRGAAAPTAWAAAASQAIALQKGELAQLWKRARDDGHHDIGKALTQVLKTAGGSALSHLYPHRGSILYA